MTGRQPRPTKNRRPPALCMRREKAAMIRENVSMSHLKAIGRHIGPLSFAALLLAGAPAFAQGGPGQGGLSADTPVLAPEPAGPHGAPGAAPAPQPKTPLPPRDTPRAPQPGQSADGPDSGPKTPLPPRDTPRAQQPGQNQGRAAHTIDPDWPCVQVKVTELSYGQMWGGPSLEAALGNWDQDADVAAIVDDLVARRTKMEDAKALIEKFAKGAGDGAQKDEKLAKLFAGVFSEINGQRTQIVNGIGRYSRKQRALSEKIKAESLKIAATQQDMASQNTPEALQQQQTLDWDTRIYDERSQQLTYVCESPVILEQRAFDLGREIQSHLSSAAQ